MTRRTLRFVLSVAALGAVWTLVARAQAPLGNGDAELQFQLANLLADETRYAEALEAFDKASHAADPALALRARKGKVKTELRLALFANARRDAEAISNDAPNDTEASTLYADALWSSGLFDEAEAIYRSA